MEMSIRFLIPIIFVGLSFAYAGQEQYRHEAADRAMSFDSRFGNLNDMRIDLNNKADINVTDGRGVTPLMVAARRGALGYLKTLLEEFPDVNARSDFDGETALMKAARYGHADIVSELLKVGAKIDLKDNNGWSAIMHAVYYCGDQSFTRHPAHQKVVKELLFRGADVEEKNLQGRTAIDLLSIHPYLPDEKNENIISTIAEILLAHGADPSVKGPFKRNALMNAASHGHLGLVKLFIVWGLDPMERDEEGKNSIDLAARYRNHSIVQYLRPNTEQFATFP
jgi:ankyrin repeat protein